MSSISAYPLRCQVPFYPFIALFGWIKPRFVSIFASLRALRSLDVFAFPGGMTRAQTIP